jgi:hypothetical protein
MVPETGIIVSMAEPNHRDREVRGRVEQHIHRGELNAANGVIADYREEIEQRVVSGFSPTSAAASAAAAAWREQAVRAVAREALGGLELAMNHPDTRREFTTVELQRALEAAYEAGRRAALTNAKGPR